MRPFLQTRTALWCIIALAILVRLAIGLATHSWEISPSDEHWGFGYEMGRVAGSLSAGEGFSYPTDPPRPTAWMAPAYPVFLASVFLLCGAYTPQAALVVLILQITVSAISCLLVYLLGRRLYGPEAGIVGAFLLAIYPPSIHFSAQKIWSSTFFSALVLLLLVFLFHFTRKPTYISSLILGFLFGFGTLLDPLLLGIFFPFILWLLWKWKSPCRTHWMMIAVVVGMFIVVLAPWAIRNYMVFGRFVLIKSNVGHEILIGNHEGSTGLLPRGMSGIEREIRGSKFPIDGLGYPESELRHLQRLNESERDNVFLGQALEFVFDNPLKFIQLTATRISRYWTVLRFPRNILEVISLTAYLAMLALGMAGLIVARRRRLPYGLLLIPLVFIPVAHYLTIVGLHRYRFPLEPILIVFAALAITSMTSPPLFASTEDPEQGPEAGADDVGCEPSSGSVTRFRLGRRNRRTSDNLRTPVAGSLREGDANPIG